jgi:general secretion pathway protein G
MPQSRSRSVPQHTGVRAVPGRGERGFTLIELMVVIVILGLLIGLVGPNVMRALLGAGEGTAKTQMQNFSASIELYYIEKKSLPQSLEELTEPDESGNPYIKKIPLDPWGQPYEYKIMDARSKTFEITSSGEDKTPGTDDDIYWPERDSK